MSAETSSSTEKEHTITDLSKYSRSRCGQQLVIAPAILAPVDTGKERAILDKELRYTDAQFQYLRQPARDAAVGVKNLYVCAQPLSASSV
jgi:hypothetical protein